MGQTEIDDLDMQSSRAREANLITFGFAVLIAIGFLPIPASYLVTAIVLAVLFMGGAAALKWTYLNWAIDHEINRPLTEDEARHAKQIQDAIEQRRRERRGFSSVTELPTAQASVAGTTDVSIDRDAGS